MFIVKKKLFFSIINFVSIFWFTPLVAQEETKIIEIIQAGGSTQDQQKFPGANILVKKDNIRVHLFHDGALIKSNISYFYPKLNFYRNCQIGVSQR